MPPNTSSFFPTTTTTAAAQEGGITSSSSSYCFEELDNNNVILIPSRSSSQQLHYPLQHTSTYFQTPTYSNNISNGAAAAALLWGRTDSISTTTNLLPALPQGLPPSLIPDHGLLQDMVPFQMVKQEERSSPAKKDIYMTSS